MNRYINAKEALKKLQTGNERYANGLRSVESMTTVLLRKQLVENGQFPFAIILTCSDSRAPAEILFDQGLGDLFVVRVAGNVIAPSLLASIEFAASTFKTQLCVVMGHTHCGAVSAAIKHHESGMKPGSANLTELIERITPSVHAIQLKKNEQSSKDITSLVTLHHVERTADLIYEQSAILRELNSVGEFTVCSAIYDLESGRVNFNL